MIINNGHVYDNKGIILGCPYNSCVSCIIAMETERNYMIYKDHIVWLM